MKDYTNVLFMDIETVSCQSKFNDLPDAGQKAWMRKSAYMIKNGLCENPEDAYHKKAGIMAEFSKVICISIAYVNHKGPAPTIRVKSFSHPDEKVLLSSFAALLDEYYNDTNYFKLCGHNLREFDIPFLCRRMLVNGIILPSMLDIAAKKRYELNQFIDTMELWKFGDYKNYTSLNTLAYAFGLNSSKNEMDGSDVHRVFYEEKDMPKIVRYCEQDVALTVKVFLKMRGEAAVKNIALQEAENR